MQLWVSLRGGGRGYEFKFARIRALGSIILHCHENFKIVMVVF